MQMSNFARAGNTRRDPGAHTKFSGARAVLSPSDESATPRFRFTRTRAKSLLNFRRSNYSCANGKGRGSRYQVDSDALLSIAARATRTDGRRVETRETGGNSRAQSIKRSPLVDYISANPICPLARAPKNCSFREIALETNYLPSPRRPPRGLR